MSFNFNKFYDGCLLGCVVALMGTTAFNAAEITRLSKQMEVLQDSLQSNSEQKANTQADAKVFEESEFYKTHDLTELSREELLKKMEKESIQLLISKEDCTHCQDVKAALLANPEWQVDSLYFYDSNEGEAFESVSDREIISTYTESTEEFAVRATPTLVTLDDDEFNCVLGSSNIQSILEKKEGGELETAKE